MSNNTYWVYFLSNKARTCLYVGVTNSLERRVQQHRQNDHKKFTSKYYLCDLLYFEEYDQIEAAIQREKRLKKWNRKWKEELIIKSNPQWQDLSADWDI